MPQASRFARVLRAREVLALSFGAMIGWSWVLMTGHWVIQAGSVGTLLAFLVGGVVITFIGLTYAELVAAMPRAGGEHVYTHVALGPGWSFLCTWALLMSYVTVCVFESAALPTAIEYLFPQIRIGSLWHVEGAPVDLGFVLIGIAGAVLVTAINVRGIRSAARVQSVLTGLILCAGLVLVGGALAWGDPAHAQPLVTEPATGVLRVLIMVPALLVGFDVLPQSAEEVDLPPRHLGWLLIASLFLAVIWYSAISFGVALSIPAAELADAPMATADAATRLWGNELAGALLILGGVGGILTSWNAFIIGASRVLFALAESGTLPAIFARLHPKYRTPYVGVLTLGMLACISPFFGRTILVWLIDAGSFAIVVAYLFVPLAFLALRRQQPQLPRPFLVRAPRFVGTSALVLTLGLFCLYLPGSPSSLIWPYEWAMVLGWALLGGALWFLRPDRGRAESTGKPS